MAIIHIGYLFAIDGIIIVSIGFSGHDHHGTGRIQTVLVCI